MEKWYVQDGPNPDHDHADDDHLIGFDLPPDDEQDRDSIFDTEDNEPV